MSSVLMTLALGGLLAACASATTAPGGGPDAAGSHCDGSSCPATCTSDSDCKNQICDPRTHTCSGCLNDQGCPSGSFCTTGHTCMRGCSAQHACGDAGVCNTDAGLCVECNGDGDCPASKPRCDGTVNQCVACLPTMDNCATGSYCVSQAGQYSCVPGCKNDTDCAPASDGGTGPSDGGTDGGSGNFAGMCDLVKHQCVQCIADKDCPLGEICQNGTCAQGCSKTQGCPGSQTCCSGACVDTTSNAQNCGACGVACAGGYICCASTCYNQNSDPMHCGGCGTTCTAQNAVAGCAQRQCTIAMCDPGFADCNGLYKDGCEVNILTNVANCGGCNNPCSLPNASPKCLNGSCAVASCNFGFGDCDGVESNGCETNVTNDVNNCGGCNTQCFIANGTSKCSLGGCVIGSCNAGYADCNNNPNDGCETNLTGGDPNNCGSCGTKCSTFNDTPMCVSSQCQLQCNSGFGDCDNNVGTGCETNTNTDVNHCGACNLNCNNVPPHAAGTKCSGGACQLNGCQSGYYDINGQYTDGCECGASGYATTCGGATFIGNIGIGQSQVKQGALVPTGAENWFTVTFTGYPAYGYHPHLIISGGNAGEFKFSVYSDCSGNAASGCGEGGTPTGVTSWEAYNNGGDPNCGVQYSCNQGTWNSVQVGNNGTVYVRVFRASGATTCNTYTLTAQNF